MFDQSLTLQGFDINQREVTLGGGANFLLGGSPFRVGLFIANYTGQVLYLSNDQNVNSAGGRFLVPNGAMHEFYWDIYGPILTLPWYAAAFQSGTKMSYTELLFYARRFL